MLFLSLLCSCGSGLKLYFKNGSEENYKKVSVQIGKNKYEFDNLKSGEKTKPITVPGSYTYCPVEIITEKDTLISFPIDYVGEKFYKSGKLTMIFAIEKIENKREIEINSSK